MKASSYSLGRKKSTSSTEARDSKHSQSHQRQANTDATLLEGDPFSHLILLKQWYSKWQSASRRKQRTASSSGSILYYNTHSPQHKGENKFNDSDNYLDYCWLNWSRNYGTLIKPGMIGGSHFTFSSSISCFSRHLNEHTTVAAVKVLVPVSTTPLGLIKYFPTTVSPEILTACARRQIREMYILKGWW